MLSVCYLLAGQCNPDVIILRASYFSMHSIESISNFFFNMEISYLLQIVLYSCNINCERVDWSLTQFLDVNVILYLTFFCKDHVNYSLKKRAEWTVLGTRLISHSCSPQVCSCCSGLVERRQFSLANFKLCTVGLHCRILSCPVDVTHALNILWNFNFLSSTSHSYVAYAIIFSLW